MKENLEQAVIKTGWDATRTSGAPVECTGSSGAKGILRLRDCSASRTNHYAQDDRLAGLGKSVLATACCILAVCAVVFAGGPPRPAAPSGKKDIGATVERSYDADAMRVQGEQRFRANCGRCHAAPQKFPPRMMATVLRHMRVRATITDQDMRLVLFYMTR